VPSLPLKPLKPRFNSKTPTLPPTPISPPLEVTSLHRVPPHQQSPSLPSLPLKLRLTNINMNPVSKPMPIHITQAHTHTHRNEEENKDSDSPFYPYTVDVEKLPEEAPTRVPSMNTVDDDFSALNADAPQPKAASQQRVFLQHHTHTSRRTPNSNPHFRPQIALLQRNNGNSHRGV